MRTVLQFIVFYWFVSIPQMWAQCPNPPEILSTDIIDALCWGDASGFIDLEVGSGQMPYTYDWADLPGSDNPKERVGLLAGVYELTITDAADCTVTASYTIDEPPMLIPQVSTTDANCGLCDGSATVSVSGGTPPYTFDFGVPNNDPNNLCPGTYDITITDANGCSSFTFFTIFGRGPSGELDVNETLNMASCGECNGNINLQPVCGTEPYTYSWAHDPTLDLSFDDQLCPGDYQVTIMDADGDSITRTFTITASGPVEVTGVVNDARCIYQPDGSVDLTVSGGRPPYAFVWSNGSSREDITGLAPGKHYVTVVDALGCIKVDSFMVGLLSDLDFDSIRSTPSCSNDGTATIYMSGGTDTIRYAWNNGGTDSTITDLAGGAVYEVTVTDDFCSFTVEVEVESDIVFEVSTTPAACDSTGGSANVTIVSGATDPDINWSNSGTGMSQNDLDVGGYSVTVSDGNTGCQTHENFFITTDSSCFVTISGYVYNDKVVPDCQVDTLSAAMRLVRVDLSNGQAVFTDADGYYEFQVPPANYTITIDTNLLAVSYLSLCTDPISVVPTMTAGVYEDNNFYFEGKDNFDLSLSVNKGRPRPGRVRNMWVSLMNNGAVPVTGTLTFQHDPRQEYRGSNYTETSYDAATQTVIWDFTDLAPGVVQTFFLNMYTDLSVSLGDTLRMTFRADPIAGDINPSNNILVDCPVITVNSYDPNDKAVLPVGEGVIGRIDQNVDKVLNYRVRFQNTGTDTAYIVVIRDQLDENLDPSTIVPGPSSHDYTLAILDGNILEFTFEDINLVDSFTNEPGSNGFVFFDVQLKDNLVAGTEIRNKADIFFDFNPPVITNTVLNTIRGVDVEISQTISGCGAVEFNGQIYTDDALVIDTINLLLYDSIVTTTIEVKDTYELNITLEYCEGENPIDPGIYTENYTAQNGCDSIIITEVIIIPTVQVAIDTTLGVDGVYNGQVYTNDTTLINTYTGQNGCDSIVTINIMVTTTSLEQGFNGNSVEIYPNPSFGSLNILFEQPLTEPIGLTIFNVLGLKLQHQVTTEQFHSLDLSNYPPGTYWIVIEQAGGRYSEKVILME